MNQGQTEGQTGAPAMCWDDAYASGEAAMDAHHHDFIAAVNGMLHADPAGFMAALDAFIAHARTHFAEEDTLMRGTSYASAKCHLDEHQAVLASAGEVRALVEQGNTVVGRRFALELARWFPEHTREMDHGLAQWSIKQRLGGARVLIRKRSEMAG